MNWLPNLQSALGLIAFPIIAWLIGCWRFKATAEITHIRKWLVAVCMQIILAFVALRFEWFQAVFTAMNQAVLQIEKAAMSGTAFVFGYLGGGDSPFEVTNPAASYILAFRALPLIVVIGALTALLTYWRILPWVISVLSNVFARTLNIGGAVALAAAANIFVGMTEAPLFIRSRFRELSRSELFMVMTLGMSTVAGTVLVLYATFLNSVLDNAIGHIFTASIISVPAAILMAFFMVPHDGLKVAASGDLTHNYRGAMDAIAQGAIGGMQMMISIIALLVSFIALVFLANAILALLPNVSDSALSVQRILGWIMAPLCWLMGIPWSEANTSGGLMGIKVTLNELLAFIQLSQLEPGTLSNRTALILSYALCGFANFGSLGIMIGGLTTLAPERRSEISELSVYSLISGTLATCMTASIVGVITSN